MQYYTNGTTITQHRPNPLIAADGSKIFTPREATYKLHGWLPCDAPEPIPEPTIEERLAPYMPIIERFLAAWTATGIGALPSTWLDAIGAVKAAGITADTALELDILWRQLLPIEDDLRAWLSQNQPQPAEEQ